MSAGLEMKNIALDDTRESYRLFYKKLFFEWQNANTMRGKCRHKI